MRRSVVLCICVIAMAWMSRVAGVPSGESDKYSFKIDSQPLGEALQEFAKQSGVQIIFFSQVTEGFRAPALNGPYTIAGALQILLSSSHLTFRVINLKTIEIRPLTATDPLDEASGHSTRGGKPSVRAEGARSRSTPSTNSGHNS